MLKAQAFDLAILDMHMPGMDGATLAARIREAGHTLPLVLFTSLGRREAADSVFAATLAKPLRQSQLFDTLVTLLGMTRRRRRAQASRARRQAAHGCRHGQRHPLRILLAEDNVVNQKLALRLLQQMGYRADVASNGIEAIECVDAPALRRGADGRADARDGRAGGQPAHHGEVASPPSARASSR